MARRKNKAADNKAARSAKPARTVSSKKKVDIYEGVDWDNAKVLELKGDNIKFQAHNGERTMIYRESLRHTKRQEVKDLAADHKG